MQAIEEVATEQEIQHVSSHIKSIEYAATTEISLIEFGTTTITRTTSQDEGNNDHTHTTTNTQQ